MINPLPQINFNPVNFNQLLSQYGFIDFVLPFLLIFSLVFMILELSNLLKVSPDDPVGRKLSALFSFGFALLSIYNQNLVKWLLSFIPSATIAIIGFTLIVIVLAITNKKIPSWLRALFAFLVIGIILWLAINSLSIAGPSSSPIASLLSYTINYLIQSGILELLIVFGLIFLVLMWLVGGGEKEEEREEEKRNSPVLLVSR
ncbi:putative membrane protein [Candidatus Nanobsidianus stetteri]|uniref:Putative membrane protein n=1 Tax=Nanobsidianus stetteri TaxID=1294122 RepID=R1G371_NANST|nr:putative membrane protein [Candidatus Nanobsidianus stetteri]